MLFIFFVARLIAMFGIKAIFEATKAGLLAYKDVVFYCAALAFAFLPFTFLFSRVKKADGMGCEPRASPCSGWLPAF